MTTSSVSNAASIVRLRRLMAMGAAKFVAGRASLAARWRRSGHRLFDFELDAEVAAIRQRLEADRAQKHRHDLANAFTAVEGAALIMARDSLSPTDRSTLAEILGSGLTRMRGLLSGGTVEDHLALADLGWKEGVGADVAPDLVVAGSPAEIGEAVRLLMAHAAGRAPASPVTVGGRRDGDRIELWMDDRGPALSARQRRKIIEPERRNPGADGVEGLHVAIRLIREQGGVLRIEARPGGGESFRVSWPAYVG